MIDAKHINNDKFKNAITQIKKMPEGTISIIMSHGEKRATAAWKLLAAAGVVETIFSILAIKHQLLFPNLNFRQRIEEHNFEPVKDLQEAEINHVVTNSFGFGGNDSSLVLSKYR